MTDIREELIRWAHFGYGVEASAVMEKAAAEIGRLRDALALCRMELRTAAYYRGYVGGPLERPSVGLALREADALKGESDE
jgi:hypothetical protein